MKLSPPAAVFLLAPWAPALASLVDLPEFDAFVAEKGQAYAHRHFLANDGDESSSSSVAIMWNVVTEKNMLELAVVAEANSWVGFGFADAGGMPGADIVVFEALANKLTDYYALEYGRPIEDTCQNDWTLVSSTVGERMIAFEATRALDTQDHQDRALMDDSDLTIMATPIIAAWGSNDGTEPSTRMKFHGNNRARSAVRFFQTSSENDQKTTADLLEELSDGSILVANNNYSIPLNETTYYDFCINVTDLLPPELIAAGVHIIGVEYVPSVQVNGVDNAAHVHHFAAFRNIGPCAPPGSPPPQAPFFYAWGPGTDPLVLPPTVGLALTGSSFYQGLALQIHYDNRNAVAGRLDSTAIRVFYVTTPRENEAGVMAVGDPPTVLVGKSVGAGHSAHEFVCHSDCMTNRFAASVTVFAEAFHQHETGSRLVSEVYRKDGSLANRAATEVWDYSNNGIKFIQQKPFEIGPGDSFKLTCYYQNQDNSTIFGYGTQDEMCMTLLFYFPEIGNPSSFCGLESLDPVCVEDYRAYDAGETFGRVFGSEPVGGQCKQASVEVDNGPSDGQAADNKDDEPVDGSSSGGTIMAKMTLVWILAAQLLLHI